MLKLLNQKYIPNNLDDFYLDNNKKKLLNFFFDSNNIKLLLISNNCGGKTTLINILLNKYYNKYYKIDKNIILNNILYINSLKDNGINFFRNEVKIFCQSNNYYNIKKLIIIDDLENINEQSQYIFLSILSKYKNNINFIFTVNNYQKILDGFLSHLNIIYLDKINFEYLKNFSNKIIKNENIDIDSNLLDYIINNSNLSLKNILSAFDKIILYDNKINIDNINLFLNNINTNIYLEYTNYCINNNFEKAISILLDIYNNGYNIIDIYDNYSDFIKNDNNLDKNIKYNILKIISKYIIIFHNINENIIELYFFTNKIILLFL